MKKIAFLLSVVVLVLAGCGQDQHNEGIPNIEKEPIVRKIGYGGPSISDVIMAKGVSEVKNGYENGDPVLSYFLAIMLLQGYKVDQDAAKGAKILEDLWVNGFVDAGYSLYDLYLNGNGVDKSIDKANNYLIKSAELGYALSQRKLAMIYAGRDTHSIEESPEKSFEWFLKAANNGDKLSALNLAGIYREGVGVEKNNELAFQWLIKTTKITFGSKTMGFAALGHYYEDGIGTEVNLIQSYKYYDLIGPRMNEDKLRISKEMTREQIRKAKQLSLSWQQENDYYQIR